MTIRLGIGYSCYNSEKEIPRSLGPIAPHVYKIYAEEGRYSNYGSGLEDPLSTDGTCKALAKFNNCHVESFSGTQIEKRQRCFDLAGEDNCDFLMVLDADEYLHPEWTDWDLFYKHLEYYSKKYPNHYTFYIKIFLDKKWRRAHNWVRRGSFRKYVRIHRSPGLQRYALGCHYFWTFKNVTDAQIIRKEVGLLSAKFVIDGVRLRIDSSLRDEQNLETRDKWALDTIEDERKYEYFVYCVHANPQILIKYPHLLKDPMYVRVRESKY